MPKRPNLPAHFVEVYLYAAARAYSNLFAKVFLWRETKNRPDQDWHATVFFANRSLEPTALHPYRNLIPSDQVTRIYLDELPPTPDRKIGMGILDLIVAKPKEVPDKAKKLLQRVDHEETTSASRSRVVELIKAVVMAHFPGLSRKELEVVVQTLDLRKTRVFQEAKAEGIAEGKAETRQEIAVRLLNKDFAPAAVAEMTGLSLRQVQRLKKSLG